MGNRFVVAERNTPYLLPPSLQEWLPENHLARFVAEAIDQLDLRRLVEAKRKIQERAQERFDREQAAYEAKLAERERKAKATGKQPGGRPPKPPEAGPQEKEQVNFTDEESRIMPTAGGGFEQAYNAQAAVDMGRRS